MGDVTVRPLEEKDLDEADHVFRLAFGTFLGLPDPTKFAEGVEFVRARRRAAPSAAFAAEIDGRLVGSNFATRWGSFGSFGPLTVRPDAWDRGVGSRLIEPVLQRFREWGTTHAGLYTMSNSPKHLGLYMKHGFQPGHLTANVQASVRPALPERVVEGYGALGEAGRHEVLAECRVLTDAIHPGLDLASEIQSVHAQSLGETILLRSDGVLDGFAVCHAGKGTEAGPGTCYAKFAAVRPGDGAAERFARLVETWESFASARRVGRLFAGVSTSRREAYAVLREHGFATASLGLAMQSGDGPAWNRPGAFVLDDWR